MSSVTTAIIGGSGSGTLLPEMTVKEHIELTTPYGNPSSPIVHGFYKDQSFYVLYRHGMSHTLLPHQINYRANIWALSELNVKAVVAIATCGAIRSTLVPGSLMVPDQLIDYTWGRESTFFDGTDGRVGHLEMTYPYCSQLREVLFLAAKNLDVTLVNGGVYGIAQGPRFETPAEINRMEIDGVDVVGMTGMPEAALAAEKSICYATVNFVVNPAAGRGNHAIGMDEIKMAWESGYKKLNRLLAETLAIANAGDPMTSDSSVMLM